MTNESVAFMDYWEAVDEAMRKHFGIDTWDAGMEADLVANAQENGDVPEEFVLWFGEKYGLTQLSDWKLTTPK